MRKILLVLTLLLLSIPSQSQSADIVIEYGVNFNELAIDTANITDEDVKKYFFKSENDAKRLLKSDRTLAVLNYYSETNTATFKRVELMDVDDQKSIYLAMSGVVEIQHDINKNMVLYRKKEINTNDIEWEITEEYKKIIGYSCQKAITIHTNPNGTQKKIVAWFATEIPIPTGPFMYVGLPGLILEVDNHLGRKIYARKINIK
jgi:GLPGLI family protein